MKIAGLEKNDIPKPLGPFIEMLQKCHDVMT